MKALSGLAFLLFAYSAEALYRCDRAGAVCSGTCTSATGVCDSCPAGNEGADCSVVTANIDQVGCTGATCLNGGTCHDDGSGAKCSCAPKWTGADCATPEYEFTCDGTTSVSLTVNSVAPVTGYLYVKGHAGTSGCFIGDGTTAPALVAIAFAGGPCSSAATVGPTVSSMDFVFRTMDDVLQDSDELITVRCGTGDTVESEVTVTEVTVDEAANLANIVEGSVPTSTDVDITLKDAADAEVTAAVVLGAPLTVEIDLSTIGATNFEKIRVEECNAYDNADKSGASVNLLTASCPGTEMSLSEDPTLSDTTVSFKFKAFKFDTVANVVLICTVKVCATAADCDAVACGGVADLGVGRKKRDTEAVENRDVGKAIRVIDPLEEAARTIQEFKETKACYQTWEMTATVVALAVALVIVLLICIILVVKAILRKRSTRNCREDVSETASTAHFPHLPTIVSNKA